MASQGGEKTEKPSARRLDDARKKGQVVRSKDLVQVASLAASLGVLVFLGPSMVRRLGLLLQTGITDAMAIGLGDVQAGDVAPRLVGGITQIGLLTAPLLAAALGGLFLVTTAQGGWIFATEALKPDWSRLNPASGFKRLGFQRGGMEMIKALVVTTLVGFIAWGAIRTVIEVSPSFARMPPLAAAAAAWDAVRGLLQSTLVGLALLAIGDYGLQRWRLMSSLKMSKDEVRDEAKLMDGNPAIKARIRKIQREMARKRMLKAVPRATVVITNPTHYAVALEYDRATMSAPRVIAKGRGFLAQRIKEIAREHNVPAIENVPLAQALYKTVSIGDTIPAALFTAVAEVLSYLIRLKRIAI
jgi:flagellar biosynthesis protein FlhB